MYAVRVQAVVFIDKADELSDKNNVVVTGGPGGQFNSFVEISTDFSTEFL